ncbi:hypothetical protein [Atlantibacter hermannii]|uniref:hypothetical protein n=1 Tax=Atlantibacter hermannii TaxID=565 RepID=UPI0028A286E2|nr:hypothetical protein [Atlantibacter hermannii]
MDLDPARIELSRASKCIERMKTSENYADYDEAWTDYLTRIENIFSRIEAASSPIKEKYLGFISPIKNLRKKDELLVYLKQARNNVHHGIAETSKSIPASFSISAKDRPVHIKGYGFDRQGNLYIDSTGPLNVKFNPERVEVTACTNRNVTFHPPQQHKGQPILTKDPLEIALIGLKFYADLIDEASKKFCS